MGTQENDILELTKLYQSHKVQCLYKNNNLYQRILRHSKRRKQSVEEYLFDLGFILSNKWITIK